MLVWLLSLWSVAEGKEISRWMNFWVDRTWWETTCTYNGWTCHVSDNGLQSYAIWCSDIPGQSMIWQMTDRGVEGIPRVLTADEERTYCNANSLPQSGMWRSSVHEIGWYPWTTYVPPKNIEQLEELASSQFVLSVDNEGKIVVRSGVDDGLVYTVGESIIDSSLMYVYAEDHRGERVMFVGFPIPGGPPELSNVLYYDKNSRLSGDWETSFSVHVWKTSDRTIRAVASQPPSENTQRAWSKQPSLSWVWSIVSSLWSGRQVLITWIVWLIWLWGIRRKKRWSANA